MPSEPSRTGGVDEDGVDEDGVDGMDEEASANPAEAGDSAPA